MPSSTLQSHWTRPPGRATSAKRNDNPNLTVNVESFGQLEQAIYMADVANTPEGWTFHKGPKRWSMGPWVVEVDVIDPTTRNKPWTGTWKVLRHGKRVSKRSFRSADRARHYAETRVDRSDGPMRGPMPRAASSSDCHLPDVRVTAAERAVALGLSKHLGFDTYSDFARALLVYVDGADLKLVDGVLVSHGG
jgi:hypothetical protein